MKALLFGLLLAGCAHAPSPLSEYVAGAVDAVKQTGLQQPPDIYVSWEQTGSMGSCKTIAGRRIVYIRPHVILRAARTTQEARSLITDVLAHELAHAALSCSDTDHQVIP